MNTPATAERERVRAAYARRTHADRYDGSRPDQIAMSRARAEAWERRLTRLGRSLGRVLEVGCGTGAVMRWASERGASHVLGVDVIADRLVANHGCRHGTSLALADGSALPVPRSAFDTVVCSTVFSSILDDRVCRTVAQEIDRVLAPTGVVLWFDFFRDNPLNRDVRPVRARDVTAWFPGYELALEPVVLAPPLARRLLRHPRLSESLERVRLLRTHLAGALWRA